ncbi:hypothetical protein ABK040_014424 [Willaertia magna]
MSKRNVKKKKEVFTTTINDANSPSKRKRQQTIIDSFLHSITKKQTTNISNPEQLQFIENLKQQQEKGKILIEEENVYVVYYQNKVPLKLTNLIYEELLLSTKQTEDNKNKYPWNQGAWVFNGVPVPSPRYYCAFTENGSYFEGKEDFNTTSWKGYDNLLQLKQLAEDIWCHECQLRIKNINENKEEKDLKQHVKHEHCGNYFNHIRIMRYDHGNHHIGFHSDTGTYDSLELGSTIISFTFGAEREFQMKRIISKTELGNIEFSQILHHGSVLIMGGTECQNKFKHALPKREGIDEMRFNITFRRNIEK